VSYTNGESDGERGWTIEATGDEIYETQLFHVRRICFEGRLVTQSNQSTVNRDWPTERRSVEFQEMIKRYQRQ
jgi:hypothetical protein